MRIKLYVNGNITASKGEGNDAVILREAGKMEKKYVIDNLAYRQLVSACIKIVKKAQNKPVFLTITFPYYPKEHEAQKIFTNFVKNMKKTYNLEKYVWVKEHGERRGKLHYHLVADYPFFDIRLIQNSFNSAIRNFNGNSNLSNNSVRLPPRSNGNSVVRDGIGMAKYIGKYISKNRYVEWKTRCYAIAKVLFPLSIEINEEIASNLLYSNDYFVAKKGEFYALTCLKDFDFFRYFT